MPLSSEQRSVAITYMQSTNMSLIGVPDDTLITLFLQKNVVSCQANMILKYLLWDLESYI